jgi:hypothetical protein
MLLAAQVLKGFTPLFFAPRSGIGHFSKFNDSIFQRIFGLVLATINRL